MTVQITSVDRVATITIDRPDRMNALDEPTRLALVTAIRESGDDPDIGAIVLTGAGRAFCAGQDLAAIRELDDAEDTVARTYNPIAEAVVATDKPVIAAVNGAAVGAGMGIALACDVVLMSETASLACVFGRVGLVPDTGTSWQLVRAVGYLRAFEIATTGRRIGAAEAVGVGLATEAVPLDDLAPRARSRALELASWPVTALALTKRILRSALHESLTQTLADEARGQGIAARHADHLRMRDEFLAR